MAVEPPRAGADDPSLPDHRSRLELACLDESSQKVEAQGKHRGLASTLPTMKEFIERPPSLEESRLFAEPLDPELEQRLETAWRVRCSDTYSANGFLLVTLQVIASVLVGAQIDGLGPQVVRLRTPYLGNGP